ncbi:MAG: putative toxin-antitoxin system toxin component, PIN family [Lachnospiraceae bacterium]|nr:putative toxin-antitoxin system toxin component, PIN family [Lachnospiraceae bacterium]
MRRYAVIDTDVLVSAMLKWTSVPGNIIEFAFTGTITPVLSDVIVAEYREVLMRDKFHLTKEIVDDVIQALKEQGVFIEADNMDYELPDSKDVVFYAIVMEKRKDSDAYLVTGNKKHFPQDPFVVTPREMMDIILNDKGYNK